MMDYTQCLYRAEAALRTAEELAHAGTEQSIHDAGVYAAIGQGWALLATAKEPKQ